MPISTCCQQGEEGAYPTRGSREAPTQPGHVLASRESDPRPLCQERPWGQGAGAVGDCHGEYWGRGEKLRPGLGLGVREDACGPRILKITEISEHLGPVR